MKYKIGDKFHYEIKRDNYRYGYEIEINATTSDGRYIRKL